MMSYLYIPDFLSVFDFWMLVALSFFTSFLTAAIGLGGGTIMLAVLAQILPVKAIIPIHGVVQLGSNFGRAAVLSGSVDKTLLLYFFIGSLAGALVGGKIAIDLPVDALRMVLGIFILYAVWAPPKLSLPATNSAWTLGGFLSTLLTMFVGATGPFVMAMLRPFKLQPMSQVATLAASLVIQHSFKVIVFGVLGFVFTPYIPLLGLMVVVGFLGTLLGRMVLLRANPPLFTGILNIVLTMLALRLIWLALGQVL